MLCFHVPIRQRYGLNGNIRTLLWLCLIILPMILHPSTTSAFLITRRDTVCSKKGIETKPNEFTSIDQCSHTANNNNFMLVFRPPLPRSTRTSTISLATTTTKRRMEELTSQENTVYEFLQVVSKSQYAFRVVVVGKNGGTILESTICPLGSVLKITQSPSKGTNLLTMASNDQLFEFHVDLSQITQIVLLEKETPSKTLRIIRLMNGTTNETLASLILSTSSSDAIEWFHHQLVGTYGPEIKLV